MLKLHGDQNTLSFPHIGMRKIKSLIAIFIGFWVWQAVRIFFPELEVHPIYMYMYGILEMRDSSEKTLDMGKKRIKSTFIALLVGLPALALAEVLKAQTDIAFVHRGIELSLIIIGVLLCLTIAEHSGCGAMCGLAAGIYIVLSVSHANDERYIYAVLRVFQTLCGVFIAWLLNVKIFPYPRKPKVKPNKQKDES